MYLKSKDRPLPEDVEEDLKGTNFCLTIQDLANLTVSPSDEEYDSLGDVPLDSRMSRLCYSRSGNLTGHSSNGSWEIDDVSFCYIQIGYSYSFIMCIIETVSKS